MIAGVDVSTKRIAIGYVAGRSASVWETTAKGEHADDRFDALVDETWEQLGSQQLSAVYIEEVPFVKGRSRQTTIRLSMVIGSVMAACVRLGLEYHLVNNLTWKRALLLSGRDVGKEGIARWAQATYPRVHFPSQDTADAIAIATYGYLERIREATEALAPGG